jgi:hypothetical protein
MALLAPVEEPSTASKAAFGYDGGLITGESAEIDG